MEATAAQAGSGSGAESAGTSVDLSPPETTNVNADKAPPGSAAPPSSKVDDDPEIDLGDLKLKRSELKARLKNEERARELVKGANKKFEEAASTRKQVEAVLASLTSNTEAALRAAGIDPDEWAQNFVASRMQRAQMTPEQLAQARREEELAQRERWVKEQQQKLEEQHQAEVVNRWQQRFEDSFSQALEQVGLPASGRALARMADLAESYLKAGADDVLFTDIAQQVKDELREETTGWVTSLKGKDLLESLTPEVVEEIRKELLARVQSPAPKPAQTPERAAPRSAAKPKFLTPDQVRAKIAKKIGATQ